MTTALELRTNTLPKIRLFATQKTVAFRLSDVLIGLKVLVVMEITSYCHISCSDRPAGCSSVLSDQLPVHGLLVICKRVFRTLVADLESSALQVNLKEGPSAD